MINQKKMEPEMVSMILKGVGSDFSGVSELFEKLANFYENMVKDKMREQMSGGGH
jgi:hypothetical protein